MPVYDIDSISGLPEIALRIVELTRDNKIVAFYGPMGAGKTTLIREICSCLGVADAVTSPTFAIINQYAAGTGDIVNHFDFYRIEKPEEALEIGCREYFDSGDLCLIEWPEKIEALLPCDTLRITIETDPCDENKRRFII